MQCTLIVETEGSVDEGDDDDGARGIGDINAGGAISADVFDKLGRRAVMRAKQEREDLLKVRMSLNGCEG